MTSPLPLPPQPPPTAKAWLRDLTTICHPNGLPAQLDRSVAADKLWPHLPVGLIPDPVRYVRERWWPEVLRKFLNEQGHVQPSSRGPRFVEQLSLPFGEWFEYEVLLATQARARIDAIRTDVAARAAAHPDEQIDVDKLSREILRRVRVVAGALAP